MQEHARCGPALLLEDFEAVVVRVAHMQHQRQAAFVRHLHLATEYVALDIARRKVVMVVQAHFAERAGARVGEHGLQRLLHFGAPMRRVVGMDASDHAHARNGHLGAGATIRTPFVGAHALVLQRCGGALGSRRGARGLEHVGQDAQRLSAPPVHHPIRRIAVFDGIHDRTDEIDAVHRAARKRKRRVGDELQMRMRVGDRGFGQRIGRFDIAPAGLFLLAEQRVAKREIACGAFEIDRADGLLGAASCPTVVSSSCHPPSDSIRILCFEELYNANRAASLRPRPRF